MMMLDSLGTRYLVDQPVNRSSVAPLNNSHVVLVTRAHLLSSRICGSSSIHHVASSDKYR
jgi:hypothetical protein